MTEPGQAWQVLIQRRPEKVLKRLPKELAERIGAAIRSLRLNPHPVGSKKLAGYDDLYRLRVGDWRIIYLIEDDRLLILVLEIAP